VISPGIQGFPCSGEDVQLRCCRSLDAQVVNP
jgi:hypothetical protein